VSADAHLPVLLRPAVDALAIESRNDGTFVDATFGRGGHSRLILERLGPRGRLIGMDRDPEAIAAARGIRDPRFTPVHARFSELQARLTALRAGGVDGVLFDLGVSSPQLDDPQRGFSFRSDGPLDMRMDPTRGQGASEWLERADESEIREVLSGYGEERFAKQIAKAIVAARRRGPVRRTGLSLALPQALAVLDSPGRLAVISFHSLEDRIVKNFMRGAARPTLPERLPVRALELPPPKLRIIGRPVKPSTEEIKANPRARSAVLRVAEKLVSSPP